MKASRLQKLSREALYAKVWATPGSLLSKELGVSDVAIAKRCRVLGVPRPPRGYWAKIKSGAHLKQPPLPDPVDISTKNSSVPKGRKMSMDKKSNPHHDLTKELIEISSKCNYNDHGMTYIKNDRLPIIRVSKSMMPHVIKIFDALLKSLTISGILFKKSYSYPNCGVFFDGDDKLYMTIEEPFIGAKGILNSQLYMPKYNQTVRLSGQLRFIFSPEFQRPDKCCYINFEAGGDVKAFIKMSHDYVCNYYLKLKASRKEAEEEAMRQKIETERLESIRRQELKNKKHAESIIKVEKLRKIDLMKASEWWQYHQVVMAFISECQRRWQESQAGVLTEVQKSWLDWAFRQAETNSPFSWGYPDPSRDGSFDPQAVPFGGPYPSNRDFEGPPEVMDVPLEEPAEQAHLKDVVRPVYSPPAKPYPFWLKHR
jgi:hypothetical protein